MRIKGLYCLFALFLAGGMPSRGGDHTKTDILHMKNGDRITCEIKSLEHGVLTIRMQYTNSDVSIDWGQVERLESKQMFVIETRKGEYYKGEITTDAEKGNFVDVKLGESSTEVPHPNIVTVEELGRNFWGRMKGSISYGFSFARSNKQTQSTLDTSLTARTEKRYTNLTASSLFSNTEGIQTNRHSVGATFSNRLGYSQWSLAAVGSYLKSDQQQLDLRTSVGGALQRKIIYTPRTSLVGLGGVVYTREKYSADVEGQNKFNSLEGVVGMQHGTYGFDRLEWLNSLWVYPSITDSGRVRSQLDSSLYYKIIGNLFFKVSVYGSYDTRPPANTPKSDYGITNSVGWSF